MPLDPKQQPPYYTPGTIPNPALTGYTAGISLTQTSTNNPSVLELWYELQFPISTALRLGTGWYEITFTGNALTSNKTIFIPAAIQSATQGTIRLFSNAADKLTIETYKLFSDGTNEVLWTPSDDILLGSQILIIVKP